nr:phospholipase SGR2 isoform X1 [Ipomoea batatas]
MVHGIGQRLEKSNLVDDVGDFRHVTASLAERHLSPYQLGTQRVLFIPCQWRKGLKLGGEAAVDKITLDGVRGFRTMLSATVHDVLYYMSPIYCQAIIDSVSNQLNRLYLKFLKRNPGYNGKVSIYGHSLGSVLSYDILCHQEILSSPFPMEWMYTGPNEKKVSFPDKSEVSLDQNVTAIVDDESLVSDRSKNIVNMLGNDIMEVDQSCPGLVEECTEFLCHPVSPPALSDSDEAAVNSVDIKQHDDRNDLGPSEQDMTKIEELESDKDKMIRSLREEIDLLTAKIRALDCWHGPEGKKGQETNTINQSEKDFPKESDSHKNYTPCIKYTKLAFKVDTFFAVGSPLGVFLSLRNVRIGIGKGQEYWEEEKINEEMPACRQMFNIFHPFDPVAYRFSLDVFQGTHEAQVRDDRSYGSIMMEKLTGSEDGRIDHVLQVYMQILRILVDKTFRHPYISAIGAHTNYWRDPDTALFILHHLYRDIPEDTHSPGGSLDGNSKHESDEGYWYDPNEEADEETPLTFADSVFLKKFSRRARRILKHQVH